MGQYYRGAIIKSYKNGKVRVRKAFCCYSHGNGAKLMEHSYVGNHYVKEYEKALANKYYGSQFVWVGDYADRGDIYNLACEYIEKNALRRAKKKGFETNPNNRWGEEFIKYVKGQESITASEKDFDEVTKYEKFETYNYIINFTKKMFVLIPKKKENDLTIHPLPLLCCDGNGRGGGDYYGTNMKLVGSWAYDEIGIGNEVPQDFTELVVTFEEQ